MPSLSTSEVIKEKVKNIAGKLYNYHALYITIIIVLFIVLFSCTRYSLVGVWTANEDFLETSGLSKVILYISEKKRGWYPAFLYASTTDTIESNKIKIKLRNGKIFINGSDILPEEAKINICKKRNILTIYNGDTVYLELYKDNILSDMANAANTIDESDDESD